MKNFRTTLLLASLLATAGLGANTSFAQVPNTTKGGEATTRAQGQINPPDKSPRVSDTSRVTVETQAAAANKTAMNKTTGQGELSTTGPHGEANALPAAESPTTSGMASPRGVAKDEARATAKNPPRMSDSAK